MNDGPPNDTQPNPDLTPDRPNLQQSYQRLTPAERSLWRYPIMWAAAAAFLFVPMVYAGVYLMSVWDPSGNLPDLPAALVNLDTGTVSRGKNVNAGHDLVVELQKDPPVNFTRYATQAAAEQAVRRGEVYFALTIPADFSRKAVSGDSSQHGLLQLYRAPGLNYYASTVADRVSSAIAEDLNATLGQNRWEVVQTSLKDVQQGFSDIHDATVKLADGAQALLDGTEKLQGGADKLAGGAETLADGAGKLADGASSLSGGVSSLAGGVTRLSGGLKQLEAAAPGEKQLAPLRKGSATLASSADQLSGGLNKLADGSDQLAAGAKKLGGGAAQVNTGTTQLATQLPALASGLGDLNTGAGQLAAGAAKLNTGVTDGLKPAADGATQLSKGAASLNAGLGKAQTGAKQAADGATQLAAGLTRLDSGLGTLQKGAQSLASGSNTLATSLKGTPAATGAQSVQTGAAQLNTGLQQSQAAASAASRGAQSLATQLPALSSGLTDLKTGAAQLQTGADKLSAGLSSGLKPLQAGAADLQSGANRLASGAASAQTGAQKAAAGAKELAAGTAQVQTGAEQLNTGAATLATNTRKAATGAAQLAAGARDLQGGVTTLTDGNIRIKKALGDITAQLPAQKDLNTLNTGGKSLAINSARLATGADTLASGATDLRGGTDDLRSGALKLRNGLTELRDKVPTDTEELGGDPDGLAQSVIVQTRATADVPNNGNAFAPYFIALALWVGATLTTFIFPFLLIPESGRTARQSARVLRKLTHPLIIVIGQALIVVTGVHLMNVSFLNPAQVVLTAVAGSVTFMIVILALNLLFGPAGRVLALILLIVQLAASGGSYPIELSSPFFRLIHTVIPVTDVINALRSAMFGAYEGQYWTFMGRMGVVAAVALVVALLSRRRWVYAPDSNFRSPIITDVG
ncbi:hypothetical protein GCM10008959_10160 [Deinococcus seoulensis]|uniref:ABC-2 type transporter transmembrane domain-containing protein n=1 Tax=Deinococcus seoulensis TaxID=1837379 RepID=A0ABQ2RMW5_9DEIO|nr:YhgE/Pip domain-containing protein [Deinococcus seoulensis]GGR50821.1 hypothetical protein GCM10008959_10160 [Deinococcus seoulensis]